MHIRKFTGNSVKEAMKSVKAEFGGDALIMSSGKSPSGGYEVVAAIDYDLSRPVTIDPAEALRKTAAPFGGRAVPEEARGELKKELKELKEVKELFQLMIARSNTPVARLHERLEEELAMNGIDRRLARKILLNAFNGVARENAGDEAALKSYMKKRLYEKIKVSDPLASRSVVAFVGPTGVGKTTTIAKLAAINALRKKRKVALVAMDTYRIAAAEQLKTYGSIIGVPVGVARDAKELSEQLAAHGDRDLVLIDTAGRSQKNKGHMEELAAIGRVSPEIKFNLVLSCQTRDEALYESVRGFGPMVDSLTFTKLDEGGVYGPILNAALLARKPVAYLTNGQSVPEDIEAASKERLVDFFMPN